MKGLGVDIIYGRFKADPHENYMTIWLKLQIWGPVCENMDHPLYSPTTKV